MTQVTHLTTEYRPNPLGIDVEQPRLAWRLQSERQGARQTAWQVGRTPDGLAGRGGQPTRSTGSGSGRFVGQRQS